MAEEKAIEGGERKREERGAEVMEMGKGKKRERQRQKRVGLLTMGSIYTNKNVFSIEEYLEDLGK